MHFRKYILKLKNKCEMWDTYLCLPRLRSAMKIQPRPKGGLIPQPARRAGDPGGSALPHHPTLSAACRDLPLCRGNGAPQGQVFMDSGCRTTPTKRWVAWWAPAGSTSWPSEASLCRAGLCCSRFLGASDGDKPHCRTSCGDKVF